MKKAIYILIGIMIFIFGYFLSVFTTERVHNYTYNVETTKVLAYIPTIEREVWCIDPKEFGYNYQCYLIYRNENDEIAYPPIDFEDGYFASIRVYK